MQLRELRNCGPLARDDGAPGRRRGLGTGLWHERRAALYSIYCICFNHTNAIMDRLLHRYSRTRTVFFIPLPTTLLLKYDPPVSEFSTFPCERTASSCDAGVASSGSAALLTPTLVFGRSSSELVVAFQL